MPKKSQINEYSDTVEILEIVHLNAVLAHVPKHM